MSCSAANGDRELNNALMFFSSRDKGGRSSSRHDWLSCLEAVRPAPTIASMHQQILTQPHVTLKSRTRKSAQSYSCFQSHCVLQGVFLLVPPRKVLNMAYVWNWSPPTEKLVFFQMLKTLSSFVSWVRPVYLVIFLLGGISSILFLGGTSKKNTLYFNPEKQQSRESGYLNDFQVHIFDWVQ